MGKDCGCGSGGTKLSPGSWVVHYQDGTTAAYRSEVEAIAEAANHPNAWAVAGN